MTSMMPSMVIPKPIGTLTKRMVAMSKLKELLTRLFPRKKTFPSDDLERFVQAQNGSCGYSVALKEIRNGQKESHWIRYFFPQMRGLGHSSFSIYFGLRGLDDAKTYLKHKVLGKRLREISRALLEHQGKPMEEIMSPLNAMKVRSCMTLFDLASPNDVFSEVLEAFYGSSRDEQTIRLLNSPRDRAISRYRFDHLVCEARTY